MLLSIVFRKLFPKEGINIKNRMIIILTAWSMLMVSVQKNMKVDKKSYKNILYYYTRYDASDEVKPLHINFDKIQEYIK